LNGKYELLRWIGEGFTSKILHARNIDDPS